MAWLLALRGRRIVAARGSGKDTAAVRELDRPRVAGMRSILRERAVDLDRIADLQRIRSPAVARQRVRRSALALPRLHGAAIVFHVEVHPNVWIGPLDFRHGADERDGLAGVEFRRERMM